jgi:hypothetical protein
VLANLFGKLAQIAIGFGINQASFNALEAEQYVLAIAILAMHDNLGALWSPFLVRWQHGRTGVSIGVLYQTLAALLVLAAICSIVIEIGTTSSTSLVAIAVSASAYVLFRRLFQILSTHYITLDNLRQAIRVNLWAGAAELVLIVGGMLVMWGQVSALYRYGVIGLLGVCATWRLIRQERIAPTPQELTLDPRGLVREVLSNWSLSLHNLLLVGYFYLIKVPLPRSFELSSEGEASLLLCISMSHTFSGVLYSFTELARPSTFRWAKREVRFPWREWGRLIGLFVAASIGYATLGYLVVSALSHGRLLPDSLATWLICALGALLIGFCYCLDTGLVALERYGSLAASSAVAAVATLISMVALTAWPLLPILVFPLVRLSYSIGALLTAARRNLPAEAI